MTLGLMVVGAAPASGYVTESATAPPIDCVEPHGDAPAAARGGIEAHPEGFDEVSPAEALQIERDRLERLDRRGAKGKAAADVTIPVHFHVVTADDGTGDVSDAQIADQIAVLNNTFGGGESGDAADTGFSFELASTERIANRGWFRSGSTSMMRKTHVGTKAELNIWTVDFGYLGIAQFPWTKSLATDGIRVKWTTLPGGSQTNFNDGETATHEVGHWLGLYHTFQGGCKDPGDFVSDTPAQASPTSGCPVGRDSCPAEGLDPIHNYMDYSFDSCYTQFTAGQSTRMDESWLAYRG
ncbi:MAG: zinc metalloprotease [Propionibacteriales bacterium]|nr:zinc metalloprotease [Propionibacteriales bacterium]